MATLKDLIAKKKQTDALKPLPVKSSTMVVSKEGKNKTVETPLADRQKILKFVNNLSSLLANPLKDIISFFKARPKDIFFIGYDKDLALYASSMDANTWIKLTKNEIKFSGYVPVPERGTIWQARNSKALFIVLEFVNCKGFLNDDEHPSIVYMDELGNTRVCRIVDWQGKFIFCDFTVGKDK